MTLENWDPTTKVTYDHQTLDELCSLRFIDAGQNSLILGPVGVGKTFLATALGHAAVRRRGSRSTQAGGGISEDGAGCGYRRGGPRSRGHAVDADAILRRAGFHDHSRRVGPTGIVPLAIYLSTGGDGFRVERLGAVR
jgi:hypothetical protein